MSYFAEDKALFQRLAKSGMAPNVVYDIGAADGGWSATVSAGLPPAQHHLFEPLASRDPYKGILRHCLSLNPQWLLHPIALSDADGETIIHISDNHCYGSTILDVDPKAGFAESTTIIQRCLDSYVKTAGLPPPDLVKMDTQASERKIIEGGKDIISKTRILLIETWLYRGYGPKTPLLCEIIDLLEPMGFALYEFGGHYRDPSGKMQSVDAVFLKPEIASILSADS